MKPIEKISHILRKESELQQNEVTALKMIEGKVLSKEKVPDIEYQMLDTLFDRYCPNVKEGHTDTMAGGDYYRDIL